MFLNIWIFLLTDSRKVIYNFSNLLLASVSRIKRNAKTEILVYFLCHREPEDAESPAHSVDQSHSRAAFRKDVSDRGAPQL